ncbi:MAG: ECF-type sigma factor [Planctomycetota bacterium]
MIAFSLAMETRANAISEILSTCKDTSVDVSRQLTPLVYETLRRFAAARLSRLPPGQTLQPTALVHEAYLRVATGAQISQQGRTQFLAAAARSMRDIIVEAARRKGSLKRGGGWRRIALEAVDESRVASDFEVLAVHEALEKLEMSEPELSQFVTLRYFGGLSTEETAEVLGVSLSTAERRWRFARAWLRSYLDDGAAQAMESAKPGDSAQV